MNALSAISQIMGWPTSDPGWTVAVRETRFGRTVLVILDPAFDHLTESAARVELLRLACSGRADEVWDALTEGDQPVTIRKAAPGAVVLVGDGAEFLLGSLIRSLRFDPEVRPSRGAEALGHTITQTFDVGAVA